MVYGDEIAGCSWFPFEFAKDALYSSLLLAVEASAGRVLQGFYVDIFFTF